MNVGTLQQRLTLVIAHVHGILLQFLQCALCIQICGLAGPSAMCCTFTPLVYQPLTHVLHKIQTTLNMHYCAYAGGWPSKLWTLTYQSATDATNIF